MLKQALLPMVILLGGLALAAGIIATGPRLEHLPPSPNAPLVRTAAAVPRTVQMSSFTHGSVSPRTESELIPEVSGRLISVSDAMVSGGFFNEGDVLLEIDPLDYEVALEQAKAALASARSELVNARKAHERQSNLASKQSTSESQRDDALNRMQLAQAALREATARLSRAERDLARTTVTAPFDGRVRSERVDIGQFVTRGAPIASLYSTDVAEVRLPIHDDELAFLQLPLNGDAADQTAPRVILRAKFAGRQHAWEGRIVRTEGELDPQTRMINVVAQVDNPYEVNGDRPPLAVGLFVEAEILGRVIDDVFVIPRSALQSDNQVYLVADDNKLAFRDVEILRMVHEEIYIHGGLRAGETVCLSTVSSAFEGMTVRPVDDSGVSLR